MMEVCFSISATVFDYIMTCYDNGEEHDSFLEYIQEMITEENKQGTEVLILNSNFQYIPGMPYCNKLFYVFNMSVPFKELQVDTVPDLSLEYFNIDDEFLHFPCPYDIAIKLKGGEKLFEFTTESECHKYHLYSTSLPKFNVELLKDVWIYQIIDANMNSTKIKQIWSNKNN